MEEARARRPRPVFLRLVRFVRPYVGVLLLALLASTLYAGARNLRAWLIKPLLDDVMLAGRANTGSADPGSAADPERDWLSRTLDRFAPDLPGLPGMAPAAQAESGAEPALAEGVRRSFGKVVLAGLLIVAVIPVAHFGQIYLVEYGLGRVLVDIQRALCRTLLLLPLGFHQRMSRGERLSRAINDATRAHRALGMLFEDVLQSLIALVVGSALLIAISWQLTLATLVVAPLLVAVIGFFGRRIRRSAHRRQESVGDLTQRLVEILSGIKVIKAFRAEAVEERSFGRHNLRLFRRSIRVVRERALSRTLVEGLNNGFSVAVLLLGTLAVLNGLWGLTAGSLAAFVTVMFTTYRPVRDLAKGWTQLQDALPSAERFFELVDEPGEVPDPADAVRLQGVRQGIRFRNVSFSYGREPVLRDVSLDVRAGELVAIVGRTGAGKTTLADLLLRFYDPDGGAIEIDGVDLRRIQRASLLDHVAVVTQDPFLFGGSIRENIQYGRPEAKPEEVLAAARAAHVDEFAEALPEGYETEVGEAGGHLSGGQRQRVTIARALLRNPPILILDEATSALDARSERYVQEALQQLLQGRTTFVIAHRLSTVRRADRIVVLDEGRVVAQGRHEELVSRGGLYSDLVDAQRGE